MRSKLRWFLAIAVVGALVVPTESLAGSDSVNRRRPPRIQLRYRGEVVQRATPYTYCWSYVYDDGSGVGMCADGFPRYPEAAEVTAPARLVIRIPYPARPTKWFLRAYRVMTRQDGYDRTVGPGETIPFRFKAHRVHGEIVAWDLVFRVEEPLREYYLETGGYLRQGDAFYALHVRT